MKKLFISLILLYCFYAIYVNWDHLWFNVGEIKLDDNCELQSINYLFNGIEPDISYQNLLSIAGKESRRIHVEDDGWDAIDLLYPTNAGKITIHWSGNTIDPVGMIEIDLNRSMDLNDQIPSAKPNLSKKNKIKVYCDDIHYLTLKMTESRISTIEYWNNP